mmetsp:Transcript_15785/g.34269  ORF Transcript_15785/g.34269 Transcript_15785/m.34269 type:complete len:278 (+) Transcript_15785:377-1210(+)
MAAPSRRHAPWTGGSASRAALSQTWRPSASSSQTFSRRSSSEAASATEYSRFSHLFVCAFCTPSMYACFLTAASWLSSISALVASRADASSPTIAPHTWHSSCERIAAVAAPSAFAFLRREGAPPLPPAAAFSPAAPTAAFCGGGGGASCCCDDSPSCRCSPPAPLRVPPGLERSAISFVTAAAASPLRNVRSCWEICVRSSESGSSAMSVLPSDGMTRGVSLESLGKKRNCKPDGSGSSISAGISFSRRSICPNWRSEDVLLHACARAENSPTAAR